MTNKNTVLLLDGWFSDGWRKELLLRSLGINVVKPRLSNWSFDRAVRTARQAYEAHRPDVVVGSSRGAVVGMNLHTGNTPLILLCPPWKRFGQVRRIEQKTVVIHGLHDKWVPVSSSVELCQNSRDVTLIVVNDDHRLNEQEGQAALLRALWIAEQGLPLVRSR